MERPVFLHAIACEVVVFRGPSTSREPPRRYFKSTTGSSSNRDPRSHSKAAGSFVSSWQIVFTFPGFRDILG